MAENELDEMHAAFDQALRAALHGLGTVGERKARSAQVKADQARVAAAADRRQFEAYQQAQDAMLREQLGNVTSPQWWDKATPDDVAQRMELAERYADVSPYARASLDNLHSEAEHRGIDLAALPDAVSDRPQVVGADVDRDGHSLDELLRDYEETSRDLAALRADAEQGDAAQNDLDAGTGWDSSSQERAYRDRLDTLEGKIDEFGPDGRNQLNTYLTSPTPEQQPTAERGPAPAAAASSSDGSASNDTGTPPESAATTARDPGYQRARATDMPTADDRHVQSRLDVAGSFVHPIRTYTTTGSKPGGGGRAAAAKRHQLKRGK